MTGLSWEAQGGRMPWRGGLHLDFLVEGCQPGPALHREAVISAASCMHSSVLMVLARIHGSLGL